jgi:HEAT repeat protein
MATLTLALVATVAFALSIVAVGLANDVRASWSERHLADGRAAIAALLASHRGEEAEAALAELSRLPRRLLLRLLRPLTVDLHGEALGRLRAIAGATGVDQLVHRRARSRRWRRRLLAAQLAHLLPRGDATRGLLMVDRQPVVRARAVESLNGIDGADHAPALVELLADSDSSVAFAAQQALLRAGTDAVPHLAAALERPEYAGGVPALEVAAFLPDPRLEPVLAALAAERDAGVRAATARALGACGTPASWPVVATLLDDAEADVRAAAAAAAGSLGATALATTLGRMLSDRVWDVRYESARALVELGPAGLLVLRCHRADADRFARDIATQMLEIAGARAPAGAPRERTALAAGA